jgi:hypothetical protein
VEDAAEYLFREADGLTVAVDAVSDDSGSGGEYVLGGLDSIGADNVGGGCDRRHAGADGGEIAEAEEVIGVGGSEGAVV